MDSRFEAEKERAARAAATLVEPGMVLGLGTGSTVAYLLPALAERALDITCVATSVATERAARSLGLGVVAFRGIDHLDLAIDGADQVDPSGWLIKGGGGAHTHEKIVAAAADRFVVIVSSNKLVDRLDPPVPLELMAFGIDVVRRVIPGIELRGGAKIPRRRCAGGLPRRSQRPRAARRPLCSPTRHCRPWPFPARAGVERPHWPQRPGRDAPDQLGVKVTGSEVGDRKICP